MDQNSGNSSYGDDTLYCLGKDEEWQREQAKKREHVQHMLAWGRFFLRPIVAGMIILGLILAFGVLPELKGLLLLGLGGFIAALIVTLFAIYHYSHVRIYGCACARK